MDSSSVTLGERDVLIATIEADGQRIAENIDWRSTTDPRIASITVAPRGRVIKVITVTFRLKNIRQPLKYFLDNQGDLYIGGEFGFGSQLGRQLVLKDRSNAVLTAIIGAFHEIENPTT